MFSIFAPTSTDDEYFRELISKITPKNTEIQCEEISSLLKTFEGNFSKKIPKLEKNFLELASIKLFFLFSKVVFKTLKKAKNVFSDKILLLIYSYLKNHNFYLFLIPFIHVIIGAILTGLLKIIIGRNRPISTVKRFCNNVRDKETSKSMPSGDSLQSANFAMMAILYFNCNMKYLVLLLIPGVMCGRVYYNCHYWFDCIIGVLLGIFVSIGSYIIINKINLHI